jgi:hypothetical protein
MVATPMKPLFRAIVTLGCLAALHFLEACSSGPVSATSCSLQMRPKNATILNATLTNNTNKRARHVGVLVNAVEHEFEVPLAPFQSRQDLVGTEYRDSDLVALTCEQAAAPKQTCRDLKKRGYRIPWPAGVPTIAPLHVRDERLGATDCWARFVIYADGTVWSVSPL